MPFALITSETLDSLHTILESETFFPTGKLHQEAHIPRHVETQITRLANMQRCCQGELCHPFCTSKHVPQAFCVLFREEQGTDLKNSMSFTPDSCQGNNADVTPSNLEVKQNSSGTADWLLTFLRVFQIYKTGSSTRYKNSIKDSLDKSEMKRSSLLVWQDLALPLLWRSFDPWPGKCRMPQMQPKKKKQKERKKKKVTHFAHF